MLKSQESTIIKNGYLIIEDLYNVLIDKELITNKNYCVKIFKIIFDSSIALLKIEKLKKVKLHNNILAQEIIGKYRQETLLPYLATFDTELLPFLHNEIELSNSEITIGKEHKKSVMVMIKQTETILNQLLKLNSQI